MATKHALAIVGALLLLSTGVIGASSFTTATVERGTNIDVVADDSGFIGLTDGNSGDVVQISSGELTISFVQGAATGVNVNSLYELGDPNDPTQRAFDLTNNDGVSHDITLSHTVTSGDGVGDGFNQTEFRVYDSTDAHVTTASEEGSATFTAASGNTYAVVVVVDTRNGSLGTAADLSGTLNVTAT